MCSKLTVNTWMALLVFLGAMTFGCSSETADKAAKAGKSTSPVASQKAAPDKPAMAGTMKSSPSEDLQASAPVKPETAGAMKTSPSEETKTSAPIEKKDNTPAEPIAAAEFPKPDGAEKPMYTSDTSTILFHQKGTVEDQAKFYTQQLGKLGWEKQPSSEISDGVGFFDFQKGSLAITVTINPLGEGMITTIAQGSGLSVPASLEQVDDDDDNGGDK